MSLICSHCHIGSPKEQEGTWARIVGSHLIVVSQIETLVCDACGKVDYNPIKLEHLNALLQSGALLDTKSRMHPAHSTEERDWFEDWLSHSA